MLDVNSSKVLYSTYNFHLSSLNSNFIILISMYKFSLEEEVDMSTCNLSKTIHNIWFQQSKNRGICLLVQHSMILCEHSSYCHYIMSFFATTLWVKCEDETHTPKSGNLESSGTPENSELEFRDQNTSH